MKEFNLMGLGINRRWDRGRVTPHNPGSFDVILLNFFHFKDFATVVQSPETAQRRPLYFASLKVEGDREYVVN